MISGYIHGLALRLKIALVAIKRLSFSLRFPKSGRGGRLLRALGLRKNCQRRRQRRSATGITGSYSDNPRRETARQETTAKGDQDNLTTKGNEQRDILFGGSTMHENDSTMETSRRDTR